MDDYCIINLFWARSETAIAELASKYETYCKGIAYNILHNNEDVDECLNDTYMSLWNAIPPQKPASLRAFAAKIIRNHSLNKYKHKNAQKRRTGDMDLIFDELEDCIPSSEGTEAAWEMNRLTDDINSFIRTLSKEKQIVFLRRYWYSDSVQGIAQRYRLSESKVKSILFRCRKKLKKYLEHKGVIL